MTIGKTPIRIAYGFSPGRPLDLLSALPSPAIATTRIEAADAISFAMTNQKAHYHRKHQPLFMKKDEWVMLRLHKRYSIPRALRITKKLTPQYVGPFQIEDKVGRLAYKLKIPLDWKIHPVFLVTQIELALSPIEDPFSRLYPTHPPPVFIDSDTDLFKSFDIERQLNRSIVKLACDNSIEYLVRWKGYDFEWDRWYNVKNPDNAAQLVLDYENGLQGT